VQNCSPRESGFIRLLIGSLAALLHVGPRPPRQRACPGSTRHLDPLPIHPTFKDPLQRRLGKLRPNPPLPAPLAGHVTINPSPGRSSFLLPNDRYEWLYITLYSRIKTDYLFSFSYTVPFMNDILCPPGLPFDTSEISALLAKDMNRLPLQLVYWSQTEVFATEVGYG
jgi:hypothetical protein